MFDVLCFLCFLWYKKHLRGGKSLACVLCFLCFLWYKKHLRGGKSLACVLCFLCFLWYKKHLRGGKSLACVLCFLCFYAFCAFCACEIFLQKKIKRFKIVLILSFTILLTCTPLTLPIENYFITYFYLWSSVRMFPFNENLLNLSLL